MVKNGPTLSSRMAIIETKFLTIVEPMALKVDQIYDQMPEMVRKVKKHHETYDDHCKFINSAEKKLELEKEERKAMISRKTDKKRYKIALASIILTGLGILLTNLWIIFK